MRATRDFGGLFLLFFLCSGATALVYEVVWSKYLALMFGSTIQAQTLVLATFMGGLALGNRLFGAWADRQQEPVRVYGMIEIGIGLYAFFFGSLYLFADSLFVSFGSKLLESPVSLTALKGGLCVGLLIIPTVLMGGTLPLMAAWLQQNSSDAGRRAARFYAVNSLGAVLGAGLAGFYLVKTLGLVSTLQTAALLNVVIGAGAMLLGRKPANESSTAVQAATQFRREFNAPKGFTLRSSTLRWAGIVVAVTGGISMGLEVLASRSLALIFGSSLQSFAVVLMAFILGIGIGGTIMASFSGRGKSCEGLIKTLLLIAALWIGLLVFHIEWWVEVYRLARSGLGQTTIGYQFHQWLTGFMSLIILGVPAALIGAVLPLLIRAVSSSSEGLGHQVGRLLTWNTLGAVFGVLLTGFVLMPMVGLRTAFIVLALGLCVMAMLVSMEKGRIGGITWPGIGMALLAALMVTGNDDWRHVLSSGVFRAREAEVDFSVMDVRKKHITIDFYRDAPDATVSVEHGDGVGAPEEWGLRINGKADASSHRDLGTQMFLSHLPMLARPSSQDVFILGLGSGITAGAMLGHPIQSLTVAENCAPVIEAAHFFESWNRGVLTNQRTRVWMEDARTILKLSPTQYDIIVTQPSNPWLAGMGNVFSREFYELASGRLKPGGIMAQWFHIYEMHDGIVGLVLRTFGAVFPHMEVWDCGSGDIILLGSQEPWSTTMDQVQTLWERPSPREDLKKLGIENPAVLFSRQLASQRTAFAIAGDGPIQTDGFPVLEYEAPRAFYIGETSTMLARYDERTRQRQHGPADKLSLLQTLTVEDLRPSFERLSTVNEELRVALDEHWSERPAKTPLVNAFFEEADSAVSQAQGLPQDAPQELSDLLAAQEMIQSDQSDQGIVIIEGLLSKRNRQSDWSAAHYAALAAKISLARTNAWQARRLLDLGLKWEPDDDELNYLARILNRLDGPRSPKPAAAP